LLETDNSNVKTALNTYKPEQYGSLISRDGPGGNVFFHFDALGSTTNVTNDGQTVLETYIYEAFGTRVSSNSFRPPFLYVGSMGYYYDALSDDYYVRARTYNAGVGRFLTKDPESLVNSIILGHLYTGNRPVAFVDPSGRLTRTTVSEQPGDWGAFTVTFDFTLDTTYDFPIVLVQRIERITRGVKKCKGAPPGARIPATPDSNYLEVIGVIRSGRRTMLDLDHGRREGIQNIGNLAANRPLSDFSDHDTLSVPSAPATATASEPDDIWRNNALTYTPPGGTASVVRTCGEIEMLGEARAFPLTKALYLSIRHWEAIQQSGSLVAFPLRFQTQQDRRQFTNIPSFWDTGWQEIEATVLQAKWECDAKAGPPEIPAGRTQLSIFSAIGVSNDRFRFVQFDQPT
jgi:RHS repeat-associated protein